VIPGHDPRDRIADGLAQIAGAVLDAALMRSTNWAGVFDILRRLSQSAAEISDIRRMVMALTEQEQAAINDLSRSIESLAGTLGQVQNAAVSQIAALRSQLDAAQSNDQMDRDTIASLRATVDQMEGDVVGALSPLTQRVQAINDGLSTPPADGGSAVTPTA
jgi:methyl-accepting chemotaxis protein